MNLSDIFNKRWFIGTIAAWVIIMGLDELFYYWWRDLNPGSKFSGVIVKHPLQDPGSPTA